MKLEDKTAINHRRRFLDMVAKSGISASILRVSPIVAGIMSHRYAQAAEATSKKVIFAFFPGGAIPGSFMPTSVTSMKAGTQNLASVASMCAFYQCDMNGGGHGGAHFALGGRIGNTSIDAQLAAVMGVTSSYSRVALGVETGNSDLIGMVPGGRIQPQNDPMAAYQQLFSAPPPAGQAQALYDKQKAAIDANLEAINAVKSKIGYEEKLRIEAHAAALQKLDARLAKAKDPVILPGCSAPVLPSQSAAASFTRTLRLQMDVAVAALQCGLTNVISLQLSNTQCDWVYSGSFTSGHHEAIHGRGDKDNIEIQNYLSAQTAYLVGRLAQTPDPATGKMLIDSTIYHQSCDFGNGAAHDTSGAPHIVATKMASFPTGTVGGGGSNIALLNKVANALGYPAVAAKFVG